MSYIFDSRTQLIEKLEAASNSLQTFGFRGVDLRGVDLTDVEFTFVSLQLACFDGANLSSAKFRYVDITNASFQGACLNNAQFHFVRGGAVNFEGVDAAGSYWDRSSLVGCNFREANLKKSSLVNSGLERVSFDAADLTLATLAWSNLDGVTFRNTNLDHVETIGTNLTDADLTTARNFAYCREIVIEVLNRHVERNLEIMQWLGAVNFLKQWCYPTWAELLKNQPNYLKKVIEIFENYPYSGCLEAFQQALRAKSDGSNGSNPS
ncbi:pentapeptide repeat-containing protein [Nostoc sp.]|uniref:pentapeptide repeat-containing protein n=1 Tax=Nostoc sp. TaxID=1180 RepID=UPI002FF461E6